MSVRLYVWREQPNETGHVSIEVDGTYMSYWPNSAAGPKDFKVGQTHEPGFPTSHRVDCRLERRNHDDEVRIGGLNTARMIDSWNDLQCNPTRYNMVQHNCSTVVASLLEVGSGIPPSFTPRMQVDDHVSNWLMRFLFRLRFLSGHLDMWTPSSVLRYATELRNRFGS